MTPCRSDLASAAFRLAMRRFAVFPLAAGAKVPPTGSHGCLDATTDLDVARARWKKFPCANIGVATGAKSGVWVFDVDPQHGGDGALVDLEREHGTRPLTIQVETPSGGCHYYWRWNAEEPEIRNSAGRVGPGLDVRGEGGSIIAPPSLLHDGRGYRWVRNGATGFADAPGWLVNAALPPPLPPRPAPKPLSGDVNRYCAAAITAELKLLAEAGQGQRNDQLNRSAFAVGQFVAAGAVPEDWARGELEGCAVQIGLPVVEARRTIDSAFKSASPRELPR